MQERPQEVIGHSAIEEFLKRMRNSGDYKGQIAFEQLRESTLGDYREFPVDLHDDLNESLRRQNITSLYSHQDDAWNSVRAGSDVVVLTSTASGKTLTYNLPVLQSVLDHPSTRALYIFPTKALAQDQLGKLAQFDLGNRLRFATYDGDTPKAQRSAIRKSAHIVLTNPDMMHVGILPSYNYWLEFLRNLKYVVVDELHVYRGVFGCHVGNILRRLFRLCASLGTEPPRVVCCSATIGNPAELAKAITGRDCEVISNDGAPKGFRRFIIWNPPLIGEGGERRSANSEATELFASLVMEGIRSIAFVRARVSAELVLRYTRSLLGEKAPELANRVESYRGGYTPEERRQIERRLFGGDLIGVTATNALELGIDVGGLDAAILNGFPGSISSLWQQAGRAGRGQQESAAFYVAHNDPLEQHMVRNPELLLNAAHEHAQANPGNPYILAQQLRCAAYERPLTDDELAWFPPEAAKVMEDLVESGMLEARYGRVFCPDNRNPAADIDIRSASGVTYDILVEGSFQRLASVEEARAFQTIHPGATYLHRGRQYLIERLDIDATTAYANGTQVNYYTEAHTETGLDVQVSVTESKAGPAKIFFGSLTVTQQVMGFTKRSLFTEEYQGYEYLDLPQRSFDTLGVWLIWPPLEGDAPSSPFATESSATTERHPPGGEEALERFGSGVHAVEHALLTSLPVLTGCDRRDIGSSWYVAHHQTLAPALFLFDDVPGGVGICEAGFQRAQEWFALALESLKDCPCKDGCPACLLLPQCASRNDFLNKQEAIRILGELTALEPSSS